MTDKELRELLVRLIRENETHDDAAKALEEIADYDHDVMLALCRYVINRMVPVLGKVPGVYKEPL